MTREAAPAFAKHLATMVLDRLVSPDLGDTYVAQLRADGHADAASLLAMAVQECRRRDLTSVLPGGAA